MASVRPSHLIATQGIELLTFATPNGYKANIVLEELKDAYGLKFVAQFIDIGQGMQKDPWYTAINPNGRIPVIVDHDNDQLAVYEGNAILSYLTRKYDLEHKISFDFNDNDYTRAESWIGWQHGGLGPMQGQANHFVRYAKERNLYGIQRYVGETERLWGVLDTHLSERHFVVGPNGGRFSIADISMIGWINDGPRAGIDVSQFPSVKQWLHRCLARPAVQRGLGMPFASDMSVTNVERRLGNDESEVLARETDLKKQIADAKQMYGYKYKSP
ncbi:glutathione s-transferase II [Colletotrichum sp. SAR 10_98]|nr:glutathione s-transferase II [Colletotrichum sp. SAR 10_98]